MKKLVLGLVSTVSIAATSMAAQCNLSVDDVKKALKPVLGRAQVAAVNPSPIDGLVEVIVKVNGRLLPIYMDCSKRYMVTGEIIDIQARKSITRERLAKLNQQALKEKEKKLETVLCKEKVEKLKSILGEQGLSRVSVVQLNNIPQKGVVEFGNPNAKVKVYTITDPQCPFCRRLHNQMEKVLQKNKNIKFEVLMFPLPFHKHAEGLAEAVVCQPNNEKAKQVLTEAFKNQRNEDKLKEIISKNACETGKAIVEKHKEFAKRVGISGTPTLIFDLGNGKGLKISGALPAKTIEDMANALKQ